MQPTLACVGERSKWDARSRGKKPPSTLHLLSLVDLRGIEDLLGIAAAIHVCLAGPVAVLAGNPVAGHASRPSWCGGCPRISCPLPHGRSRKSRRPQNPPKPRLWPACPPSFPSEQLHHRSGAHSGLRKHQHQTSLQSGLFPRTAPISNRATGLSLCMKIPPWLLLIASSLNRCPLV